MKVDEAGRADTFNIAAVGRDVKVGLENLVLAVKSFQLCGANDLLDLPAQSSRVDAETLTRELHSYGGSPDAPAADEIGGTKGTQN